LSSLVLVLVLVLMMSLLIAGIVTRKSLTWTPLVPDRILVDE
jgi:hypothetical protein